MPTFCCFLIDTSRVGNPYCRRFLFFGRHTDTQTHTLLLHNVRPSEEIYSIKTYTLVTIQQTIQNNPTLFASELLSVFVSVCCNSKKEKTSNSRNLKSPPTPGCLAFSVAFWFRLLLQINQNLCHSEIWNQKSNEKPK